MTDAILDNRPKIFWSYATLIDEHGAELGAYGISVYCVLARMGGESGVCFPAIPTIAAKIGASDTVVKDALQKLAHLGYIKITPRHKEGNPKERISNLYTLLPVGVGRQETQGGSPDAYEVVMMKINKAYNDTFALYPTPMIEEQLLGLVQEYPEADVVDAFKEAAIYGGRTLAYVRQTLRGWKANGREKKAAPNNPPKPTESTPIRPSRIVR